jgi:mRNA interferase MazF
MGLVIHQYEVYLIDLDPTKGNEIQKTRPCLVISPDEINQTIGTVIIAPLTTKSHNYPTRVALSFQNKHGWIVFDQIRTVDKSRLIKKLGKIEENVIHKTKAILREMLVD